MTDAIAALKLRVEDAADRFVSVDAALRQQLAEIAAAGTSAVPEVAFADIVSGTVAPELPNLVRRRGCVVVRRVFSPAQATEWNAELDAYLDGNDAAGAMRARRPDRWGDATPQMFSAYWSRPQVAARQSEELAATRAWLNRLWRWRGHFQPDQDCTYADRVRRRLPGDTSLKLGPHIDGGTVGRWLGASLPYMDVLAGDPNRFDPFDAAHRPDSGDADANACSAFRSFQGWTALTAQGPGDGTLQVVPLARAIAWVLLRPFAPDVPENSLCGAERGAALWITPEWHAALLRALVPIPRVAPGDTVWWHPDLIHAVEPVHTGTAPSSVMYIPAAPDCPRNRAFLPRQWGAFVDGSSPPDFPPDHLETAFAGRAGPTALTALGRRQMGG
jgi:Gig2-like